MSLKNRQKTVLLVEDNYDNLTVYETIFGHAGYNVLTARDGQQGVETALSHEPDMILLDLSMPRMDGWQAMEVLRSDPRTREIPVCALTAHVLLEGDWDRVKAAGFECYLTKPIEPKKVLHEVQRRIGPP